MQERLCRQPAGCWPGVCQRRGRTTAASPPSQRGRVRGPGQQPSDSSGTADGSYEGHCNARRSVSRAASRSTHRRQRQWRSPGAISDRLYERVASASPWRWRDGTRRANPVYRSRARLWALTSAYSQPLLIVDRARTNRTRRPTARGSPADSSFLVIRCAATTVRVKDCPTSNRRTRSGSRSLRRIGQNSPISRRRSPPPALRYAEQTSRLKV